MSDEDFWAAQLPVPEAAMASGDYPHLAALEDDAWDVKAEEALLLLIVTVLDGLERFVERRVDEPA